MPRKEDSIQLTELERLTITTKVGAPRYLNSVKAMNDLFSYVEQLLTTAFLMGKES